MAFKINNFFNSPLKNIDEGERINQNNRRVDEERRALYEKLKNERQHVTDVRGNVKNVVNDALSGKDEYTLSRNDTIRPRWLGDENPKDVLGGKLVKKSTFDWLEGDESTDQQSRQGCNSYACAVGAESGMRVPVNDNEGPDGAKGGVYMYEESANGGKGGKVWYPSGAPMPVVPWNQRFDERAKDLGFELQPEGTTVEAGDFIRQGYDEEYYDGGWDYDDEGNATGIGRSRPGTSHSIIATDSVENLGRGAYNSGNIYEGLRAGSAGGYGIKDSDFDADTANRIQRYVGSTPYYEQQFRDFVNDPNNKLQAIDNSALKSDVMLSEPEENLEGLLTLPTNRFDESTLSKKDLRKLNKLRNK